MTNHFSHYLIALLAAGAPFVQCIAAEMSPDNNPANVRPARTQEDKEQLERRLASLSTLIETSSAARQIEASANPQALALRGKARESRQLAEDAFKKGRHSEATGLLDQAAKLMFEGVRLASPEQVTGAKHQREREQVVLVNDARVEARASLA